MNTDTNHPTVQETCQILNCSRAMLDKYEKQGKLMRVRDNKPIRYYRESVEALADDLARRRNEAKPKPNVVPGDDPYWAGLEREAEASYQAAERQMRERAAAALKPKDESPDALAGMKSDLEKVRRALEQQREDQSWTQSRPTESGVDLPLLGMFVLFGAAVFAATKIKPIEPVPQTAQERRMEELYMKMMRGEETTDAERLEYFEHLRNLRKTRRLNELNAKCARGEATLEEQKEYVGLLIPSLQHCESRSAVDP